MTVNYELTAHHVIRDFVLKNMIDDGILNLNDYIYTDTSSGVIFHMKPVIPLADEPALKNNFGNKPYIVTDFSINGYIDDFWNIEEEMTFSIRSNDYRTLTKWTMYIIDLLRRMDITAKEINDYQLDPESILEGDPKFNFHFIYVNNVLNTPEVDELDIKIGEIWFRYQYSRYIGDNGKFI